MQPLKLFSIPDNAYAEYRRKAIFQAYKWDPQVGDNNTVAKYAVVMDREAARHLENLAERLVKETVLLEEALLKNLSLAKNLGLPKQVLRALPRLSSYDPSSNVRLMRFDFHPTDTGWAVSEVNSDVPGGFAEASVLPGIAAGYFDCCAAGKNLASALRNAFKAKIDKEKALIAFVHATSYSDDRQVMQFLGDYFEARGYNTLFAAPDHISWRGNKAYAFFEGGEREIDGIVRFFPLEWMPNLPKKSDWKGYFSSRTPSCNHPVAIFAQSKRLPLVWDKLGVGLPAWKQLLPDTYCPKKFKGADGEFIYKPALGRVGEGISIKEAVTPKELAKIKKAAHRHPKDFIVQRRFKSIPIEADDGSAFHLCVGVFTVDSECAGFYGRISPYPRIDANARDIPILIEE
ncbi:MAG: glutathionylspermidine synthase family protein [Firmicutes bacterium]|nr:glutathionylspermidine synthase family protein [Bacillota bacterium]